VETLFVQLVPITLLGAIYAVIVFIAAKKRGVNPWPWAISSLVPIVGMIVSGVFFLLTFLSMLDRLNALEKAD